MKRFIEKIVFFGLVIAWRLAGSPTLRSPPSTNATIEGVVRLPSLFAITTGSLPSSTATHEFVVPKSIPIIFPILFIIKLIFHVLISNNVPKIKLWENI
jgi:hypothetical protein